jgi:putative DNA primase/helicase
VLSRDFLSSSALSPAGMAPIRVKANGHDRLAEGGALDFVLPAHLAKQVTQFADAIRVAAPSEKLSAFTLCARQVFGLGTPDEFPLAERADRLQAMAEAHGLVAEHGNYVVQWILADARTEPIVVDEFTPRLGDTVEQPTGHIGAASQRDVSLIIRWASEIEAQPIKWLWPNRIAIGKQTLIAGDPGLGKSQLAAYLAAVVTTGGQWPCGEGRATRGSAVIFSAEDDAADTIVPRLIAAGADLSRVRIVDAVAMDDGRGNTSRRMFHLQADLGRLEAALEEMGDVRLVIIDPITAYLGGVDTHRNSDVRGVLGMVAEMAARRGVAVVAISHWNKSGVGTAVNRVTGSGAFTAAVRAAFMVAKDPDDDERRLFVPMKNNLARIDGGLAFRLEQHMVGEGNAILASAIAWDSERVNRTADEILAATDNMGDSQSAKEETLDWLRELLGDGPLPAKQVRSEADAAGHSWATVTRAKKDGGLIAFREGGAAGDGRWFWCLPGMEPLRGSPRAYLAQERNVSPLGNLEPLSGGDLGPDEPADGAPRPGEGVRL